MGLDGDGEEDWRNKKRDVTSESVTSLFYELKGITLCELCEIH